MNIGDKMDLRPTVFGNGAEIVNNGPQPCRVVYIHPQWRFFTVEFRNAITGETWREVMYFTDRGGEIRRKE